LRDIVLCGEWKKVLQSILHFSDLVILCDSYEGEPLSPPKGEAARGENPLTPPYLLSIFINLQGIIALWKMAGRRRQKVRWTEATGSDSFLDFP
jgi:hypothetical protein